MIIKEAELNDLASKAKKGYAISEEKTFSFVPQAKPTVFLSHKHNENDNHIVDNVKTILELHGCEAVYIDWQDPKMQHKTNRDTATVLRNEISGHQKFILVVTAESVKSPWCNWELGFGDAVKGKDVALFCLEQHDNDWRDHEYLQLYPTIELDLNNIDNQKPQYQVVFRNNGKTFSYHLKNWLKN